MEWKPIVSQGLVPDEPFVPDFNEETRVQAVGLTATIRIERKKENVIKGLSSRTRGKQDALELDECSSSHALG